MDDVIFLISQSFTLNEYGVRVSTETKKQVFAKVRSVSRAEFFDGGRNGLNPEYQFDVATVDYSGEIICEYHGSRFTIYRTFVSGDYTELYVEKRGGTNAEPG